MLVNQAYVDCYTNYTWDKGDYSSLEEHFTNEVETEINDIANIVESKSIATKQIIPLLPSITSYGLVAQDLDRKYKTSTPTLVADASILEQFYMTKLVKAVEAKNLTINKTEVVAMSLLFGMIEINKLATIQKEKKQAIRKEMEESLTSLQGIRKKYDINKVNPNTQNFLKQVDDQIMKFQAKLKDLPQ